MMPILADNKNIIVIDTHFVYTNLELVVWKISQTETFVN